MRGFFEIHDMCLIPAPHSRWRTSPVTDNARETGASLEVMYRFVLWLVRTLEGFPRSQRFLLGDRMQTAAMLSCGRPGTAQYRP